MNSTLARCERALQEAAQLIGAGYPIVSLCAPVEGGLCSAPWHERPCERAGKRPITQYKAAGAALRSVAFVQQSIRKCWPCNLAIMLLPGRVVVEADSPAAEAEVRSLAGSACNATPMREARPGRGPAWIFEVPERAHTANRAHLGTSGAIDVRASGGLLVVPPSIHKTGHSYVWAAGRAPWLLRAVAAPPGLLALIERPPPAPSKLGPPLVIAAATSPSAMSIPSRVNAIMASDREFRALWNGVGKTGRDTSVSGYDYAIARYLLRRGVRDNEVAVALAMRPGSRRRDASYLARTIAAAAASLARTR
jgi:hypothetical protein